MSERWPNFYELAGNPETGELLRRVHPDAPVEVLRESGFAQVNLGEVVVDVPAGAVVADAFKMSGVRNVKITRLVVGGAGIVKENSWDANKLCADVFVTSAVLQEWSQNALTWKGGCRNFSIGRLAIVGRGGHCDIEAGNYSEQSREKSDGLTIDEVDGSYGPVRFRVGWARNVTIHRGPTQYQALPSLGLKLYVPLMQRINGGAK